MVKFPSTLVLIGAVASEGGHFLVRQPVGYWIHMLTHRVANNLLPKWSFSSWVFDSALLLNVAIAFLLYLIITKQLATRIKDAVFMSAVIGLFANSIYLNSMRAYELEKEIDYAFPKPIGFAESATAAAFDPLAFLANSFGRSENLKPTHSDVLFKSISTPKPNPCVGALCDLHVFPGDGTDRLADVHPAVGHNLYMDVFDLVEDRSSTLPPMIVHIHGGGWRAGNRRFLKWNYRGGLPAALAKKYVLFSVSYRLTPDGWDGDAMLEDVKDALAFAKRWCADSLKCDHTKVGVTGTSAGGHLAMLLALSGDDSIKAVLDLYGPVELRRSELEAEFENGLLPWYERVYAKALGHFSKQLCPSVDDEDCFERLSPVALVERLGNKKPPAVVIAHGHSDGLVSLTQPRKLFEALKAHGQRHVAFVDCPCHDHDFDVRNSSPCAQMTAYATMRMFAFAFA